MRPIPQGPLAEGGEMRARFMFENPSDIEATMKITMSIKEWENLRDQLAERWPSARLSMCITSLLSEARKVAYEEKDATV